MRLVEAVFVTVVSGLIVSFVLITFNNFLTRMKDAAKKRQGSGRVEKVVFDVREEKERKKRL